MNPNTRSDLTCPTQTDEAARLDERDAVDLAAFERDVAAAKESGATHVAVCDDFPRALWQFDPPDDPYPAWYVHHPNVLKVFPPEELRPFVDLEYADRVARIVKERCRVLREHGLKAHWDSLEPQELPEGFFAAYPHLRGARVDQPNRSRVTHFAPCVDQPQMLRLYREALRTMWSRCPEINSFAFFTSDSGSGFCWVPGLYPGINGHSDCKHRPMADRVAGFMRNFQTAADEFDITVTMNITPIGARQWMTPTFSEEVRESIVRQLPAGMAIEGREGPDGRPFASGNRVAHSGQTQDRFYPVIGLPAAGRLDGGDRACAVAAVGEELADELMNIEACFREAQIRLDALDFGGMLRFGHLLGRWINRPMVPFPDELTPEERAYYRRHLFQARTEEQADNLVDIQGMLMYRGWGAKMLFQRIIEGTVPVMQRALESARRIAAGTANEGLGREWSAHARRVEAVICLLRSADHMVSYQAHLDRVRKLDLEPEYDPPLGVQSDWARTDMMELARREIDNTVKLMQLIQSTEEPIIDTAPTPEEEYTMRLGPDLVEQLKRKIDTMNAHWRDYDRIFTVPNL